MRVDEAACNQQQETVVRLITENKVKIMPILSAFKILIDSLISNTSNQGLRELLEISQRSLSTPVQRAKRPAPTIHKEVTVVLRGYSRKSGQPRALVLAILLLNFRCKLRLLLMKLRWSPCQDLELQELPLLKVFQPQNPVNRRMIQVLLQDFHSKAKMIPFSGRTSADLSSGDSDETGSEDESIKFDTIQRAGRRRTMVEKEEEKVDKEEEEKPEEKNVGEKGVEKVVVEKQEEKVVEKQKEQVVEKQEEKVVEKKQDGVVEKLLDEMVSKSMEDESSVKESSKEDEKAGVVESVVEQLVSDTVDGSSPALCLDNSGHLAEEEVKKSQVLKVDENLPNSDCTKRCTEKSDTAENHKDDASKDSDTVKVVEVSKTGETSKGSVEPTRSNEKSEDLVAKENALANHVEVDSESTVKEDSPSEKSEAASVVSKAPASNHSRSNSRGKKGKGEKNSPKKKKPNS